MRIGAEVFKETAEAARETVQRAFLEQATAGQAIDLPQRDKEAWDRVHAWRFTYFRRFGRLPRLGLVKRRFTRERTGDRYRRPFDDKLYLAQTKAERRQGHLARAKQRRINKALDEDQRVYHDR